MWPSKQSDICQKRILAHFKRDLISHAQNSAKHKTIHFVAKELRFALYDEIQAVKKRKCY